MKPRQSGKKPIRAKTEIARPAEQNHEEGSRQSSGTAGKRPNGSILPDICRITGRFQWDNFGHAAHGTMR